MFFIFIFVILGLAEEPGNRLNGKWKTDCGSLVCSFFFSRNNHRGKTRREMPSFLVLP